MTVEILDELVPGTLPQSRAPQEPPYNPPLPPGMYGSEHPLDPTRPDESTVRLTRIATW